MKDQHQLSGFLKYLSQLIASNLQTDISLMIQQPYQ